MAEQSQLPFNAPTDDPVSIYFASGLTSLNSDQHSIVELVSGLLAEFCSDQKICVHQPVLHTDPANTPDLTPEQVRQIDHEKVASSDALIVLADFASWGGGMEIVWAERLRLPMLLLARDHESISRLLRGSTADVHIHEWRNHNDLRAAWHGFFLGRKSQLEAHRRLRADRQMMWGPTVARIREAFDELASDKRNELYAVAQLSDRRVAELLSSAVIWAEASMDEVQALTGALGLPSSTYVAGDAAVSVSTRDLAALQHASELERWSGSKTIDLLRKAELELARGGTRRLRFSAPEDWVDFEHDDG